MFLIPPLLLGPLTIQRVCVSTSTSSSLKSATASCTPSDRDVTTLFNWFFNALSASLATYISDAPSTSTRVPELSSIKMVDTN